jgi:hypothetical protein
MGIPALWAWTAKAFTFVDTRAPSRIEIEIEIATASTLAFVDVRFMLRILCCSEVFGEYCRIGYLDDGNVDRWVYDSFKMSVGFCFYAMR